MSALFTDDARASQTLGHPEQPLRRGAVLSACLPIFREMDKTAGPGSQLWQLCLIHSPAYVETLMHELQTKAISTERLYQIDGDTCWRTVWAARVGSACALVDRVMGEVVFGFQRCGRLVIMLNLTGRWGSVCFHLCHCRPLCRASRAERVAVLDFDIHHGNGAAAFGINQIYCMPPAIRCRSVRDGQLMNAARVIFSTCLLRKAQVSRDCLAGENSFCQLLPLAIRTSRHISRV